jgi:hypothetical protein
MRIFSTIPFICIAMLLAGCGSANKMRMPLAAIDRPMVDPKGTWSMSPSIETYSITSDTIAYRGFGYTNILVPPMSYSFTDNLKLFSNNLFSPTLLWELTKSTYTDTSARYKWQLAVSAGLNFFWLYNYSGNFGLSWKKRLSPSVWYSGNVFGTWAKEHDKRMTIPEGGGGSAIGFQLSPRASVGNSISLYYSDYFGHYHFPNVNDVGYNWYFNFQYDFSSWFSFYFGSGISGYQKQRGIESNIGGQFFW